MILQVSPRGRLFGPLGWHRCALGRGGVRRDKREGDGATPIGRFPLRAAYYRSDRLPRPETGLPLAPLTPEDRWCDDPDSPLYNRFLRGTCPARHERLWRADGLYDLMVVIGYNDAPPVPSLGSAIFLHCAAPDFAATEGCVALATRTLRALLPFLTRGTEIAIGAEAEA